jgi:hypothetical protein
MTTLRTVPCDRSAHLSGAQVQQQPPRCFVLSLPTTINTPELVDELSKQRLKPGTPFQGVLFALEELLLLRRRHG